MQFPIVQMETITDKFSQFTQKSAAAGLTFLWVKFVAILLGNGMAGTE